MGTFESPHPVLVGGTDLLALIPHPQVADLRRDATREGPPDSQPGPGPGRTVQGGRSPARSAAEGALDRPTRPAHSTSGRPRPSLPTATEWGTRSSCGGNRESPSTPRSKTRTNRPHKLRSPQPQPPATPAPPAGHAGAAPPTRHTSSPTPSAASCVMAGKHACSNPAPTEGAGSRSRLAPSPRARSLQPSQPAAVTERGTDAETTPSPPWQPHKVRAAPVGHAPGSAQP